MGRRAAVATLVLVAGLAGTGAAAAQERAPAQGRIDGITVVRWVQRDADGHVVRRGATATLPGTRAVRPPAVLPATTVVTARRGLGGTVRTVRPQAGSQTATATK